MGSMDLMGKKREIKNLVLDIKIDDEEQFIQVIISSIAIKHI
jgi:hypothetical protein